MVERNAARWGSAGGAILASLGLLAGASPAWLSSAPLFQLGTVAVLGGGNGGSSAAGNRERGAPRKRGRPKGRELLWAALFAAASTLGYFGLLVLFGAPWTTEHESTFSLACLLAALTVLPASLYAGVESTVAMLTGSRWFTGDSFVEMLQLNLILTLIGTWCGAIVIPLDWDRPWQAWPIPCYMGAIVGYIFSNIITNIKLIPSVAKVLSKKSKFGIFI